MHQNVFVFYILYTELAHVNVLAQNFVQYSTRSHETSVLNIYQGFQIVSLENSDPGPI